MKKLIRNTLLILCVMPSIALATGDTSGEVDYTSGIQNTFQASQRSVYIQAEMLRTQLDILTNLVVLNEQIAAQNKILRDLQATKVLSEKEANALKKDLKKDILVK